MSFTEADQLLLKDRRLLLKFLLERDLAHEPLPSNAVLDEIDVPQFLHRLRQGHPFTLPEVTRATNPFVPNASPSRSPSFASPAKQGHTLLPKVTQDQAWEANGDCAPSTSGREADVPVLVLPGLSRIGNLDNEHLQSLVYVVFLTSTSHNPDEGLLRLMRKQLKLSEQRAAELHKAVGLAISRGVGMEQAVAQTLRLPLLMLQHLLPEAFTSFSSFAAWQRTVCRMLLSLYCQAANGWQQLPPGQKGSKQFRQLTARLRGCLRRVQLEHEDDYDREEYELALEALTACAEHIATVSGCGYRLPFGMRLRICELMLGGVFGHSSGASPSGKVGITDTFVEEKEDLLEMLQVMVWPALEISRTVHNALYAWIHFRQFVCTGNMLLLRPTKRLLQGLLDDPIGYMSYDGTPPALSRSRQHSRTPSQLLLSPHAGILPETVPTEEEELASAVNSTVSNWLTTKLSNYHALYKGNPRLMQGMLELYAVSESGVVGGPGVEEGCRRCCHASLTLETARAADDAREASASDSHQQLAMLADAYREIYALEMNEFAPILDSYLPDFPSMVAEMLHSLYGQQLLPWFSTVRGLSLHTVQLVRKAEQLEKELNTVVQAGRLEPWGLSGKLAPLLFEWVGEKLGQLREWRQRLMEKEDWVGVTKQQPCGRAALELVKMSMQTVDSLFEMQLQLPTQLIRTMLEGIDESITKYAEFVATSVTGVESLIPPLPPLTRYKRDLWLKSVANESKGKKAPLLEDEAQQAALQGNNLAPLAGQRNANVTTTALVVRMNSLSYVYDALPKIRSAMEDRWIAEQDMSELQRMNSMDMFLGVLEDAKHKLERAMDRLCRYAAYKVIWRDMCKEWQEFLYRWSVDRGRLDVVLQRMDAVLGQLVSTCAESLSKPIAKNMLRASVSAYKRVLLDGGAARWYTVEDVPLLQEDVVKLKGFFEAGGDGLLVQEIETETKELTQLLRVMSIPTSQLSAVLERARTQLPNGAAASDPMHDKDVLTKVLCHRADRDASKVVKADKVPKIAKKGLLARLQ